MAPNSLSPTAAGWIKVMAEYESCGLWTEEGAEADIDALPLSATTKDRFTAWCRWYDKVPTHNPERLSSFPWAAFTREGRELANLVKQEMPTWTVIFFDDEAAMIGPFDGSPEPYQYEIK